MTEPMQPQLVMIHDHIFQLPEVSDIQPFRVASFQTGNEDAWETIIGESFQSPFSFEGFMRQDAEFRPDRVLFLMDHEVPVATASAWHHAKLGSGTGYLHMVGIKNAYAGQGLGQIITHAALLQMRQEGRDKALLNTDDFRIPAIITYLRLGFVPKLTHESHESRWKAIADQIRDSGMKATITGALTSSESFRQ